MTAGHKMQLSLKLISAELLLSILFGSINFVGVSTQFIYEIPTNGTINDGSRVDVTIHVGKVLGLNNLSLGVQVDGEWRIWRDSSILRRLAQDSNFKLVRVFDFRQTSPPLMPVINWNESAKTGTFNWTNIDTLVQRIFEIGAEPLFCLGGTRTPPITNYLPPGMSVNPATGLPYPESYAAYAREWVKHFKALARPVRYYEIMNEPFFYFGWTPNLTKLGYYVELWNTAARAMRAVNPGLFISQDFITVKKVFDYWVQYGDDVDFLDFHKYDGYHIGDYNDTTMFTRAEQLCFETTTSRYGVEAARQKWLSARGRLLPVINSESNFNSAWSYGTDSRIQQMVGAVWTALVLRMSVLKGLQYNVYYEFSNSASYWQTNSSGGYGFGMVNSDNNQPWYPYYAQKWLGNNLSVGDSIVDSASSSDDVRVLAWLHEGKPNLLLISKVDRSRTVYMQGLTGQLNFSKIDSSISYLVPKVQTGVLGPAQPLAMNGYTVMLLQTSSP